MIRNRILILVQTKIYFLAKQLQNRITIFNHTKITVKNRYVSFEL